MFLVYPRLVTSYASAFNYLLCTNMIVKTQLINYYRKMMSHQILESSSCENHCKAIVCIRLELANIDGNCVTAYWRSSKRNWVVADLKLPITYMHGRLHQQILPLVLVNLLSASVNLKFIPGTQMKKKKHLAKK